MKEILIIVLVPLFAILTVMAFRQYVNSFGSPAEMDMDNRLFPERF